ncbi:MAG: hypothetical protein PWP23_2707 [Candidatus Sumerlaeota bacterium]|nr:hypothetical protein [Candidatus Sumerlaeota bacterium]
MMHSVRSILALLILLVLAGCRQLGLGGATVADPPAAVELPLLAVWVSGEQAREAAVNSAGARAFLATLREHGVGEIVVQGKANDGTPLLGTPAGSEGQRALERLVAAGKTERVAVSLAWPVFLGTPAPGEELVEYVWIAERNAAVLRPYFPAMDEGPPRLNPAIASVRERELDHLRALATSGVGSLVLTHLDYPSLRVDFSTASRLRLESALGSTLRTWPEDVLTFEPDADGVVLPSRQPVWGAWTTERAETLRRFFFAAHQAVTQAALSANAPRPAVWAMGDGYYPLQYQRGLNWADPLAPVNIVLPDAPTGYAETGIGGLADGLVLDLPVPLASPREAMDAGLLWWSSVGGALDVARRVVPGRVTVRAALHVRAFAGTDDELDAQERETLRAAIETAARGGSPVLILDAAALDRWQAWDAVRP